jgi:GTP cyclohydrolase II
MRSSQAPRSERLRLENERSQPGSPETITSNKGGRVPSASSPTTATRPKRKMSIDPSPVAQVLQRASPFNTNFFHPAATSPIASPSLTYAQSGAGVQRPQVRCMARTRIPTPHGELFLHLYHNSQDQKEHLAIVIDPIQLDEDVRDRAPRGRKEIRSRTLDAVWREGETDMERVVRGAYVGRLLPGGEGQTSRPLQSPESLQAVDEEPEVDILPLVRIHSECFTGETIGSMRCDCGEQLDEALRQIAQSQTLPRTPGASVAENTPSSSRAPSPSATLASSSGPTVPGRGVVIYMRQEGRGIGLLEKIRAYNLQDLGHDTVTANLMLGHGADERSYAVAGEILRDLGVAGDDSNAQGIRLLTNNPEKVEGLAKEGVKVAERVGMVPRDWARAVNSPKAGPKDLEDNEKEYEGWRMRRAGVGLIGAGAARGPELEKYLRTKVERMGHSESSNSVLQVDLS